MSMITLSGSTPAERQACCCSWGLILWYRGTRQRKTHWKWWGLLKPPSLQWHTSSNKGTVPNPSKTNRGLFSFKPQSVILNKVACTCSSCLSLCELLRHVSSYFLSIKKSQVICSLSIELFKIHYIYFFSDVCFASIFSHSVSCCFILLADFFAAQHLTLLYRHFQIHGILLFKKNWNSFFENFVYDFCI